MKTPEEMAEEWANYRCPEQGPEFIVWCMCREDFLAGYKAAQQWISVKERLPEFGELFLAYFDKSFYKVLSCVEGACNDYGYCLPIYCDLNEERANDDFTHWMPLPEAPKENE